ncbi:MAG TPA: Lrp/AsnC ligand binding domain-containing protein, partial [Actinophytocola sp.]|uniref:Lrp/AsnC family transcriptional regulator n=1 Tax=Actinophytocola sp. TaxID=1872138 RepID=UPI002E030601|nr:Lrp/AsnC ligand binding domain-containing protein [Actinophytocola sp.]
GVIRGYSARLNVDAVGLPLTAFISLTPTDPGAPDDYPQRLESIREIESCYSVAGDYSYVLLVRVASPTALEDLLRRIREAAKVSTRTTVVLSTPFEARSPAL